MDDLSAAGLNQTEAKTYKALLTRKQWLPSELAQTVSETRTNVYKILDGLVAQGLAERLDEHKKLHYRAANPARLLELARDIRTAREQAEQTLQANSHELMRQYVATQEQAAVQFFQGKVEIARIFEDIAHAKTSVKFLHTLAGSDFYGYDYMFGLRQLAVSAGVKRSALAPDTNVGTSNYKATDAKLLLNRTWLRAEDYTAPVEWGVYDDKLYIISYDSEALGMVIESPQIANAFRQMYRIMERGQKAQPWYDTLPTLAGKPESLPTSH